MAQRLDSPASAAATSLNYPVSAGTLRRLMVGVTTEGTQSGNHTCTYGDQSGTLVATELAGSGTTQQTVSLFTWTEAQIAAASGTTITPGNVPTDISISARSYEFCDQGTITNTDTDTSDAATPNPLAACDITTSGPNSVVVAISGMGNAGSAAWAAPLTEATDQATASANGSMADGEIASATTVACECTWTTQNRAAIAACELVHDAGATKTQAAYRFEDDDGSESGSSFLDSQNTAISRSTEAPFRVRVGVQATGDPAAEALTLEYKESSDPASEWRPVRPV